MIHHENFCGMTRSFTFISVGCSGNLVASWFICVEFHAVKFFFALARRMSLVLIVLSRHQCYLLVNQSARFGHSSHELNCTTKTGVMLSDLSN